LTVGTITPGTAATSLGKARDLAAGASDVGVAILAIRDDALSTITPAEGDWDALKIDANGALWVNLATKLDSTNDSVSVVGNVAHDAVDSGNPVKGGGKAIAHGTNPTAVAAADRTDWYFNRAGVPFVIGGHPNIVTLETAYTGAQTDAALVTVSAGTKIVVTQVQALCDNANTVDVGIRVGFGSANTPTTTGVVLTHPGIAPGSGNSRGSGSSIVGVGADGEDLRTTCEVPTGGSIRILVSYYTIES
jgi:hypothetical protein